MLAIKKLEGTKHFCTVETGFKDGKYILRIRLDDGSVFTFASIQILMRHFRLVSEDEAPGNIPSLEDRDKRLEDLWQQFGDVPMNPETERMEAPFLHFSVGTEREEIWHWFDERHSKGVAYLMYGCN